MALFTLWRRLFRGARLQRPVRSRRFRPSVESLEDRSLLANLVWVGAADAPWSVAANWNPAQIPGNGDNLIFDGQQGANTDSKMDLGGGTNYHIAGLEIRANYTKTITLQSSLFVDVLTMDGGTIAPAPDTTKFLAITQDSQSLTFPATVFGTSRFSGGTIKSNTFTLGENAHRVTLVLAGGGATPSLEANLTTNGFTTAEWRRGNVNVAGGKTITVQGTFLADSAGTMGNNTAVWNLVADGGTIIKGKGTFNTVNEVKKGGGTITKVASAIPEGPDVFVVIGTITEEEGGGITTVESGTLSVQGDYIQPSGSTTIYAGQVLSIAGTLQQTGGTLTLQGGTLNASGGYTLGSSALLTGSGDIYADLTTEGAVDGAGLTVHGQFQQNDGTTSVSYTLTVDGSLVLGGGLLDLSGNLLTVFGPLQQTGGTISLASGTLSITAGYNLGAAALLEGSGSITADILSDGAIDVGGTGAAGTLGIAGNYTQSGSGLLNLEFGDAGNRDLLSVSGAVTLDGTLLISTLAGFAGGQVTVIDNTGPSPISGTFAGLPEGSIFSLDGYLYQLTYEGGDDNDVVLNPYSPSAGQWANSVIDFSSEYTPGDWSAAQALGVPDTSDYGDIITAWAPWPINGSLEYLTLGFETPVYATGVTVRETYGNGFVYQVDLLDVDDQLHTIWTGTDPSQPGTPVEFTIAFAATPYLVKGVKIYVDTDHDLNAWEEIDAVMLHGDTGGGGGFAALSAPGPTGAAPRPTRVASVKKPNRGPSATLRAGGPVALGRAVDLLFSNPRDGFRSVPASSFRYSFDFNNDGDFTDAAEVVNGTSTTARHTFTRRGWQVIHGRVLGPNGRYTDFWLRVFVS